MIRRYFNPRTREGCDVIFCSFAYPFYEFQSTHPRRVRPKSGMLHARVGDDFNPRTREGCDTDNIAAYLLAENISIHAPAKGATKIYLPVICGQNYFNPRTREGCDSRNLRCNRRIVYFNPRTREGCDLSYPMP